MKDFTLAHIADIHIGQYPGKVETGGFNSRYLDFVRTFNESVDKMISDKVDLCLIAGDIFKTKTPGPDELDAFTDGILRLINDKIPTVIVLGNHDFALGDKRSHSFAAIQRALENFDSDMLMISTEPEIITLNTKNEQHIQVQTMPYPHKGRLGLIKTADIEQWMVKKINDLYEGRDKSLPILFAGHFSIGGATISGEQINIDKFSEPLLPKSVFEGKDYKYVAMGHLHQYQIVLKSPLVVYCGSNNRVDFNEAKEDKGFVEAKINDEGVKHRFIKVNARKFIDLKYDLSEEVVPQDKIKLLLNAEIDNIKDAVVRIDVTLSSANRFKYDDGEVEKLLNKYCYHIHGTTIPNIKAEDAIHEVDGFKESMGVIEALKHYAETRSVVNKEAFLALGDRVVKKVHGGNTNALP